MKYIRLMTTALSLGVAIAIAVLSLLAIVWHQKGGRILTVQTGSMSPALVPKDIVIIQPIKPAYLLPGDIVSYKSLQNPKVTVTHRLLAVDDKTNRFIIKGDSLSSPDPLVPSTAIIGKVNWYIPRAGYVAAIILHPIGLACIVYLPAVLLLRRELINIRGRFKPQTYQLFQGRH